MRYVYISYSRHDGDYARKYAEELQRRGFKVLFDTRVLYNHYPIDRGYRLLRLSAAVSAVISSAALEDINFEMEILTAEMVKKPTFPLFLEDNDHKLPGSITFADVTDGSLPSDDFFARLAKVAPAEPPHVVESANWLDDRLGLTPDAPETEETPPFSDTPAVDGLARLESVMWLSKSLSWTIRSLLRESEKGYQLRGILSRPIEVTLAAYDTNAEFESNLVATTLPTLSPQEYVQLRGSGWEGIGLLIHKVWVLSDNPDLPDEIANSLVEACEILGVPPSDIMGEILSKEPSVIAAGVNQSVADAISSGIEGQRKSGLRTVPIRWQIGRASLVLSPLSGQPQEIGARVELHDLRGWGVEYLRKNSWVLLGGQATITWVVTDDPYLVDDIAEALVTANYMLGAARLYIAIETFGL